jgi:transcriptional antiterminator
MLLYYEKFERRIKYLNELIEKQCTGTPKELAGRLGISERMLYYYLDDLKTSKEIRFCRKRKSYVFQYCNEIAGKDDYFE